jgi:hypothetical protein
MKKIKVLLLAMMLTLTAVISAVSTSAASSDYLPGGKNYLGATNLEYTPQGNFDTINNIKVKPNTDYVLSFGYHGITQGTEIYIELYNDTSMFSDLYFSNSEIANNDRNVDGETVLYITFNTGSANYIKVDMNDLSFSSVNHAFDEFLQLEEGTIPTSYETYIEPVGDDNVAPEYTYSNVSVDSPYYDLLTVSEIQSQLQAVDDQDGDVSDRIQVYEDQYTSITPKVVGDEYFIMFMVDDTAGNSAYLRVDVNVVDDKLPTIQHNSTTHQDGAVFNFEWFDDEYSPATLSNTPFAQFFSNSTLIDEYHGNATFENGALSSTAIADGWTESITGDVFDPFTPGNYTVNQHYTDPSGNTMTITFNITINSNDAPVINGPNSIDYEAVDFNANDVLNDYSATDTEDGNLTLSIKSHDHSSNVLGAYTFVLSATDSFGIETTKTITVNLVDTTPGVFKIDGIQASTYNHTVNMSDTTSLQALIDSITVTDAYDGNITTDMVIPTYPSFEVPGTSDLTLSVTDSSGNTSTLVITVTVADDIPPVVNGATKIVKGLTETLTLSDIFAELTVSDNVDSNLSLDLISDTYTGNSSNVGSYLVKYKATDTAGNITYHDVRVWVVDNQAPAWIINDYFVNLGINESMTRAELVSLLQSAGMIGSDISYTVTFLSDEYSGNEEIEGAYSVVMNITYENGSEEQIAVQMNVPEPVSDDVITVEPEENLTGFQKLWNGITDFGNKAWNIIKAIWNFGTDVLGGVWDFFFERDANVIPVDDTEETTTLSSELPYDDNDTTEPTELPYTPTTGIPAYEI